VVGDARDAVLLGPQQPQHVACDGPVDDAVAGPKAVGLCAVGSGGRPGRPRPPAVPLVGLGCRPGGGAVFEHPPGQARNGGVAEQQRDGKSGTETGFYERADPHRADRVKTERDQVLGRVEVLECQAQYVGHLLSQPVAGFVPGRSIRTGEGGTGRRTYRAGPAPLDQTGQWTGHGRAGRAHGHHVQRDGEPQGVGVPALGCSECGVEEREALIGGQGGDTGAG
jgi:hypothetical protein